MPPNLFDMWDECGLVVLSTSIDVASCEGAYSALIPAHIGTISNNLDSLEQGVFAEPQENIRVLSGRLFSIRMGTE